MLLKVIEPIGYCFGVKLALNKLNEIKNNHPHEKIYILGEIIHNNAVTEDLISKGFLILKDYNLDSLSNDGIYIISAHGLNDSSINKLKERNIVFYNLTCPNILNYRNSFNSNNDSIKILFGKTNHAEVSTLINSDSSISFFDIDKDASFEKVLDNKKKYTILFQSNLPSTSIQNIINKLDKLQINYKVNKNVCTQFESREKAISNIKEHFDFGIVVGSKQSNNANSLLNIYQKNTNIAKSILIDSIDDLKKENINCDDKIVITSATSSPDFQINAIIDYLKEL